MVELVPPDQVRARITAFASHSGLLYALMASMSTVGMMWEAGVDPNTVAAAPTGFTQAFGYITGVNLHDVTRLVMAPLFCISAFLNVQGLLLSMLALGRIQVLPDSQVRRFVLDNNLGLHGTGLCLIPATAAFSVGLVCGVDLTHGEPTTSVAAVSCLALGLCTTYQTVRLGLSTERLSLQQGVPEVSLQERRLGDARSNSTG